MPIPLPNLDDLRWDDLVEEARSLIPAWAPEWTDHNPTDPGITLIELFAYVSEMLLYRVNRVSRLNIEAFLQLINGPGPGPCGSLEERIRATIRRLSRIERAVTAEDYEKLAVRAGAGRARCIPDRDFGTGKAYAYMLEAPGHVSVVVCPPKGQPEDDTLLDKVEEALEQARLLAVQVHVLFPSYVDLSVRVTLVPDRTANRAAVWMEAVRRLAQFFDPVEGGTDKKGWPFGRDVYVSEIYELLGGVPGVEYVRKTAAAETGVLLDEIDASPGRRHYNRLRELEAVEIQANELVRVKPEITI